MNDSNEQQGTATEPSQKSPPSALAIVCATMAVVVSAVIAFVGTCLPVGYMAYDLGGGVISEEATPEQVARTQQLLVFSCGVGICAALLVGYMVYRVFRKHWNEA